MGGQKTEKGEVKEFARSLCIEAGAPSQPERLMLFIQVHIKTV
jgi:hypothetical protein